MENTENADEIKYTNEDIMAKLATIESLILEMSQAQLQIKKDTTKMSEHIDAVDKVVSKVSLNWLGGLSLATRDTLRAAGGGAAASKIEAAKDASPNSMRIYSIAEQDRLGPECLGFISFLESSGVLPATMREIVLDRAMASSADTLCLEDLKIIVLMVYWSFGPEPDALVLDELCDDASGRIAH